MTLTQLREKMRIRNTYICNVYVIRGRLWCVRVCTRVCVRVRACFCEFWNLSDFSSEEKKKKKKKRKKKSKVCYFGISPVEARQDRKDGVVCILVASV